jgi:hypothetical protein
LVRDSFDSNANQQDNNISELPDPLTSPESCTSSRGEFGIDNAIAEMDNNVSGLSNPSTGKRTFDTATEQYSAFPRKEGIPELNNTATAEIVSDHSVQFSAKRNIESDPRNAVGLRLQDSPFPSSTSAAVGLPFESPPPLSESAVEAAIQNIARAGYLSIAHAAAINADQTPSQQGTNATTANSQSKKRMETETEKEGSGKQTKKRAKIAIPAREQSLRYDAALSLGSWLC